VSEHEDCRKCRDWKGCPGKEWFGYHEIRWCVQQVFWILKYADILHEGQWPAPDATAPGGMRGKSVTEAAFAKVVLVIAELDSRLSKTGWRGRLLAEECKNREMMMFLSNDAKDALYYVVGRGRRELPFNDWRKQRNYRRGEQKVRV